MIITSLALKGFSQNTILVAIVQNNLVYHSLDDGKIKYIPLSSNVFSSEAPRSIDYDPDNCIYYVITDFRSTPKLYTVTHSGKVNFVGTISSSNGQSVYSCEAIAYSTYNKKTYVSISFPNRDYWTETIAEIDINTAECTPITTVKTSLPEDSDADFMECYDTLLIISDNNASPSYTTLFSFDLTTLSSSSKETFIYSDNSFLNFQELTVINDKVYVEEAKKLYELDLTASTKSFDYVQDLNYTGFSGTSTALTSFNHNEIFGINIHNDTIICSGDSVEIDPSKYTRFIWYDGSTGNKTFKNPGTYSGTTQVGSCVFNSDTFSISIKTCDTCKSHYETIDTTSLLSINDTLICDSDSIKIGVPILPNWNIVWSTGSSQDSIVITTAGKYYVTYSYGDCNFQTKTITVGLKTCDSCNIKTLKLIDFFMTIDDVALCLGDSFMLDLSNYADSVEWSFGSEDLNIKIKETIDIRGTIYIDTCIYYSPSINLTFYSCERCDPYIPNAFTPNGDELNDVFRPIFHPDCLYEIENFRVYNRWGEKLLDSDIAIWDGVYLSELSQMDVYFYILSVNYLSENRKARYVGDIHLVK